MGKGRRTKELAKLQKQWHDVNLQFQSRQQAQRQQAANARLVEETGNNQILHHKHRSYTIKGPSRLSTSTDYLTNISVPFQVTPDAIDTSSSDLFFDFDDDDEDAAYTIYNEHVVDTTVEPKKRRRTAADNPIALWVKEHETYLLELLWLEGRGDYVFTEVCPGSSECNGYPEYQCRDYFGTALYCKDCIVARHRESPLHRIQHWDDGHFKCTSLKDLGLRIQLGHSVWGRCCNPSPTFHDDFVVLDVTGVHQVAVDFCACEIAQSPTTQLLHAHWFPATTIDPKTAATFCLLHHFHILTFESKASAFEVWQTLSRLTDNTGISTPKDCYEALLRMVRKWRNVTLLKWLYGLFLAIDANFCLARKNVSSDMVDPGLNQGWAYFVKEHSYKLFLQDVGKQVQENSTCVSHNTVNLAETKNSCGLAATGARTVDCARHNFKWPCGVGNLQKGEKYIFISGRCFLYINMDYLFFLTMQHAEDLITLNISYNIACQWSKHLWECMALYPSQMHIKCDSKFMTFLVPKFHLPAHNLRGMGHTDGEALEHGWPNINPVATSTREMGPGSQCDTLDNHFGDFNRKKVANLGISLLRKLKAAIPERDQHQCDFHELNETLIAERMEEVAIWKQGVEKWEADMSATNPFSPTTATMTQASVRLTLSQEEAQELKRGINSSLHNEISPAVLISSGIEIEEEQHRLLRDLSALGDHATDLQCSKLQDHTNALQRKVEQWCEGSSLVHAEEKAYKIRLWLPSQLKDCAPDATLTSAGISFVSHLYKFKDVNIRGQRANTCAAAVIKKVEHNDGWQNIFPMLEPAHVRRMSEGEAGQSKGNRTLSWIWKTQGVSAVGEVLADALRIEWCKARARVNRWTEEHVREFLSWHAT
ncbi:hypothetical protein DFJ58DRAFT_712725 [Suillus subalutaceus]|uniref:uncharacterized protein n=1 Tax=Suillus subalutaceus TaxID=48586 RepID=UPI001B864638|nr:uncharacterized protein DFJ58DRAFT_712725 [Suillus subalutaceus]KAG1878131.1 hypothetical protein DFJ58DRAFT_712725 [Suillus subalutaceus]